MQSFQYKIIYKTLAWNECLKNNNIKMENPCSFCNNVDSISYFIIDCSTNTLFWKRVAKWWEARTGFNTREENHTHGFPGGNDDAIVIKYCILYVNHYVYLEKLKERNKKKRFNVNILGYLCHFKYTLKVEKNICIKKNQIVKFDKFNVIFENL